MSCHRSLGAAGAVVAVALVATPVATAHVSPPGCAGNGLDADIQGPGAVQRNGDVVSLTPSYSNAPMGCHVTSASVTVTLPSPDGAPGGGEVVVVATDPEIPPGASPEVLPALDYTVAFNESVFTSPATVRVSGMVHDSPIHGSAGVSASTQVVISRPHVTFSVLPEPSSGPAPLAVGYTYLATNDSPLDPGAGAIQPAVGGAQVSDDRCAPVTLTGGDTDGDGVLDQGEAWRYACSTSFGAGVFAQTATFTGTSTLDGRPWPAATAHSTVTATEPVVTEDRVRPRLRLIALSPTRFRAARSGPSIAARRARVGTKVTYSLSERSSVRFTVDRRKRGRRVGGRCAKPRRSNRMRKPCTRWVKAKGSFARSGVGGRGTFKFSGRVGGKRLAPGRYRLNGVARDSAGNSSTTARKSFRIVRLWD
jgi:hypothetical protein